MAGKSEEKRELILAKAEQVFIRKGFNGVTMKDIIEECEISRGGIYLYYSSVDEIFTEVIKRHNQSNAEKIIIDIENSSFEVLLDKYFEIQKSRLLHMENSLLLAMFEFFIVHKQEPDKDFFSGAFDILENTLIEILNCGVKEGYIREDNARVVAANILFCIKGLETLAMSNGVSDKLVDTQFEFYKKMFFHE